MSAEKSFKQGRISVTQMGTALSVDWRSLVSLCTCLSLNEVVSHLVILPYPFPHPLLHPHMARSSIQYQLPHGLAQTTQTNMIIIPSLI